MESYKSILVTADTRLADHPILDLAAEIITGTSGLLTVAEFIPEFSWLARISMPDHRELLELMIKEKAKQLDSLVSPLREKGINVETKVLVGKTSVAITRQASSGNYDLVMTPSKGQHSRNSGPLGQTAKGLLRNCPSAVWLVAATGPTRPRHILGCVDTSSEHAIDSELNEKILETGSSLSGSYNAELSIVHAWRMQDEAMLSTRLKSEAVARYIDRDREYRKERFEEFLKQHSSFHPQRGHLVEGRTLDVLASFVKENKVDLVVMGTVGRSGVAGMVIGNTAERLLDEIECSILALKPDGFRCRLLE